MLQSNVESLKHRSFCYFRDHGYMVLLDQYSFDFAVYKHGQQHSLYLVRVLEKTTVSPLELIRMVRVAN